MIPCHGCGSLIDRPHVLDAAESELCPDCAAHVCGLGCGVFVPPACRLPYVNGGKTTSVHQACADRLNRARMVERTALLLRRSGPAFGSARGGRS